MKAAMTDADDTTRLCPRRRLTRTRSLQRRRSRQKKSCVNGLRILAGCDDFSILEPSTSPAVSGTLSVTRLVR